MRTLWWTLAVFSLGLLSIFLSQTRTLDPVQNLSLTIASPLERGLRQVVDPVSDFFAGVFHRGELVRENQRLRAELESLQSQLAAAGDAEQRLRELEGALAVVEERPEDQFVVANVIAQDPSGFKQMLAIDRGASDGLDEGMVVLSNNGSLIGALTQVFDDFSWLRLISDPNSAVNATVLTDGGRGEGVRGVAVGELGGGLSLDLLPSDADIADGDLVTTSGLGGNYPRALLLGTVRAVDDRPLALTKRAEMEPAADLVSLDTVLVIVTFRPARLEGP